MLKLTKFLGNKCYTVNYDNGRVTIIVHHNSGSFNNVRKQSTIDMLMAYVIEADHAEALAMNAEYDAESARIERLCPGTTEEKNQFKAIAAKYILGVALLFTGAVAHAETLPQYPNQAVRLSMQGYTSVSINCDTKRVKVNSESTSATYFSRQVKKDVYSICYGESGILNRKYIFEMDRNNGRHNMLATDPGRCSLTIKAVKED